MKTRHLSIAIIAGGLAVPALAAAAGDTRDPSPGSLEQSRDATTRARPGGDASQQDDRTRMKQWSEEKDRLTRNLRKGEDKSFYRQELERLGYKVTALNSDKPDYVEYEIVKDGHTYEVQIDLDANGKAEKVDVTGNLWKAEETDKALEQSRPKGRQ